MRALDDCQRLLLVIPGKPRANFPADVEGKMVLTAKLRITVTVDLRGRL